MKILFLLRHANYTRNYESLIRKLCEQGFDVHLGLESTRINVNDELPRMLADEYSNLTFDYTPRLDFELKPFVDGIRNLRNFLRYMVPLLRDCHSLRERPEGQVAPWLVKFFRKCPPSFGHFAHKVGDRLLAFMDEVTPVPNSVINYVHRHRPRFVLLTPLIDLRTNFVDYVKACRHTAIPTCLCVASWDNLTNKGIIQGKPDFVIVWNEIQKQEAIELHNVEPDQVYTTGAQLFDQWFERKPNCTREEFIETTGLKPNTPIITYLCSSGFISRDEVDFCCKWIESIRSSKNPMIANSAILIRPHPASGPKFWSKLDKRLTEVDNFSVWPLGGQATNDPVAKDSFFNTLYWSDVIVGINTSAFIEAGIVDKPCLTIENSDYSDTQGGTVHFHYLKDGGLVHSSLSFEDHLKQLEEALTDPQYMLKPARDFIKSFVRPHGLDKQATDILFNTITGKLPRRFKERKHIHWRSPRIPINRIGHALLSPYFFLKNAHKECSQSKDILTDRPLKTIITNKFQKQVGGKRINHMLEIQDSQRKFIRSAKKTAAQDKPIIVGPWLSEVGFELLYWVPFIQHWMEKYDVNPDNVIAISRGGCESWYQHITKNYVDIFSIDSVEDFYRKNEKRIKEGEGRKQFEISAYDNELIEAVKQKSGIQSCEVMHPSVMYGLFREFWTGYVGYGSLEERLKFMPLNMETDGIAEKLGLRRKEYAAVKFYYSAGLPDSSATQEFIQGLFKSLLDRYEKVLILDTSIKVDDHDEFSVFDNPRIINSASLCTPENNLAIQTALVADAAAFYGTYGGFSYLAPLHGVDSYNFYSHTFKAVTAHLHVADRAFNSAELGSFMPVHTKAWGEMEKIIFNAKEKAVNKL